MYVETSFYNYETEKLKVEKKKATAKRDAEFLPNPLYGEDHAYRNGKDSRAKQALKMMYVGFSRPTHLLCFAALKENIGSESGLLKQSGWKIMDLTVN